MAQHIQDFCEDKARKGDGNFAVAFALLEIARQQEQVAKKLGQLGFDGPSGHMGALEYLGVKVDKIANALESLNVNALLSGSVEIDNG